MGFKFPSGNFERKDQYLTYDFNTFLADIGGFLGLLLGQSIWSLYIIVLAKMDSRKTKVVDP